MDNMYMCTLCNMQIAIAQKEQHMQGKKHVLKMKAQQVREKKEKCGIYVRGTPASNQEELKKFFEKFGTVKYLSPGNGFCIVEFKDEDVARRLLRQQKLYYMGTPLYIKRRIVKEHNTNPQPRAKENLQNAREREIKRICSNIENLPDVEDQISKMIEVLKIDETALLKYDTLCQDLEAVLQQLYPQCKVHRFGSTVTELASESSDVDIFVEVPLNFRESDDFPAQAVKKARNILSKKTNLFKECIAIANAKTPIVKCIHVKTNLLCDFNFKNKLGVNNSQFIKYYITIDQKIKPLMMLVRQWVKAHDFINTNRKFNNYALIMMVIFFLQQEPYCLPSVESLQNEDNVTMHEGWNIGFKEKVINASALQGTSLTTLIASFFKYYSEFNYYLYILCPFLGKQVCKLDFLQKDKIPKDYKYCLDKITNSANLDVDTPICVQDPFEHCHNLTKAVSKQFLEELVQYFKFAAKEFDGPKPSIYNVLTKTPPPLVNNNKLSDKKVEFTLNLGSKIKYLLNLCGETQEIGEEILRKIWFDFVVDFINKFLVDVLKFDVSVEPAKNTGKVIKLDGQNNVHDLADSLIMDCKGQYCTWDGRKSAAKTFVDERKCSLLEKEIQLSNCMISTMSSNKPIDTLVHMKIVVQDTDLFVATCIADDINSKKGHFYNLAVFLSTRIAALFATHETYLSAGFHYKMNK